MAIFTKQNGRLSAFLVDTCYKYNQQDLEILALIVKTYSNIIYYLIVAYIPPEKTEQMKLLSDQIFNMQIGAKFWLEISMLKVENVMIKYARKVVKFWIN